MLLIIPIFFLAMFIEYGYTHLKKQERYRFNDTITNLNIGIGNQVFSLFSKGILLGVYISFYENYALLEIPITTLNFILTIFVYDFLFYWAHRWGHEINFFWGAHSVHHQSEEYNLSVALRQSWFHDMIAFFIFLPAPILGFPPELFFPALLLGTLYQFWIHTETIDKLPRPIEFFFNTPSHHRVHHAVNPKYIDKNHAAIFIIWDKMFGTFKAEEERPTYGITTQLKSWNPTWANTHYYIDLWNYAKQLPRWRDRLKLLFARPGHLPEELGGIQAIPEVDKSVYKKFNASTSMLLNLYVLLQFVSIVLGLIAFMAWFPELYPFYQVVFALMIIVSMMICGGILENKWWTVYAEYARLFLLLLSLNSLYYFCFMDWFVVMLVASVVVAGLFGLWFGVAWRGRVVGGGKSGH